MRTPGYHYWNPFWRVYIAWDAAKDLQRWQARQRYREWWAQTYGQDHDYLAQVEAWRAQKAASDRQGLWVAITVSAVILAAWVALFAFMWWVGTVA